MVGVSCSTAFSSPARSGSQRRQSRFQQMRGALVPGFVTRSNNEPGILLAR
jgi:hypothetical protein